MKMGRKSRKATLKRFPSPGICGTEPARVWFIRSETKFPGFKHIHSTMAIGMRALPAILRSLNAVSC